VANRRDGVGVLLGATGNSFRGQWKGDKKHGAGMVVFVSGIHERLVGRWVNDRMDGWGCMLNRNGDRLEGAFVNDKLQGLASVFLANGSEFHGAFNEGRMDGEGTYTYGDGSRYKGEFRDDKRHGSGVYDYLSGDRCGPPPSAVRLPARPALMGARRLSDMRLLLIGWSTDGKNQKRIQRGAATTKHDGLSGAGQVRGGVAGRQAARPGPHGVRQPRHLQRPVCTHSRAHAESHTHTRQL
jgi:hypothetical protein